MPVRLTLESARSVHDLCAAVITTAERARAAAWDAASAAPTSTAICSISWYRIAAASTVTLECVHVVLDEPCAVVAEGFARSRE